MQKRVFSAIGNAYAVLSDKDKRQKYDMYGADHAATSPRRGSGFYEYDYSRGFEGKPYDTELQKHKFKIKARSTMPKLRVENLRHIIS